MKCVVEHTFYDLKHTCLGWSYQNFETVFEDLINRMRERIGSPFTRDEHHNLKIFMNLPLYNEFSIICQRSCRDSNIYKGIEIIKDLTLYVNSAQDGLVRLVYEESETKLNPYRRYCNDDLILAHELYYSSVRKGNPHIDHVKFNGPATIVFWKDGTKTVVKHDGKGRKDKRLAVLYAFIRKIYGEGKPYHNILNEIEEAIK